MTSSVRSVVQSAGRILTLARGAQRGQDVDEEDPTKLGSRNFAAIGGFASFHVRVKDVKEYYQKREMKRKRRLGLQLEIIFLCFFFPLCVYWNALFGQTDQVVKELMTKPFPSFPIYGEAGQHSPAILTYLEGFANEEQFWQWMNNVIYDEIFVKGKCGLAVGRGQNGDASGVTMNNITTQVPIVGGQVRLRQVRVAASTCPKAASLMNITCYPAFEEDLEATRPIVGPLNLTGGYKYETAASTTEQEFPGEFAVYPGSGYVINFTTGVPPGNVCLPEFQIATGRLLAARRASFIDAGTRALILTLTTFSPNTGALVTTRLTTEISFSGLFHTSFSNQGILFFRTASDWLTMQVLTMFVVVIECMFIISSFWGLVFGWEIENRTWTIADLVTSGVMMYQMYLLLSAFFVPDFYGSFADSINARTGDGKWAGAGFYSGSELTLLVNVQSTNSVILLFSVFRLFRYSQYLDTMQNIHGTINRTFNDMVLYFFLLLLLSLGYVLCGMVVLSSYLKAWSTYPTGIFTLTQYFVLIVDYYSMNSIKPFGIYIAPIFLCTFLFIFTWYMFAVFLAVIYVGYRAERNANQRQHEKRRGWGRFADENGALCIAENERYQSSSLSSNGTDDEMNDPDATNNNSTSSNSPCGILTRQTFYYSSWKESLRELLRQFIGVPERSGFAENATIIRALADYEDNWLRQNLPNLPAKRYLVSFSELMNIINGKTVDLIEELRRISNNATAAEEYRRVHAGRFTEEQGRAQRERYEGPEDAYLDSMHPLEIQLARLFRTLWIVPDDRLELFARMETDDSAGQIKRLLLVRMQEAMRTLDERETESTKLIAAKVQSLKVVQRTMERDMKALRDLLK